MIDERSSVIQGILLFAVYSQFSSHRYNHFHLRKTCSQVPNNLLHRLVGGALN